MPLALLFPPSLGQVTASARAELLSDWLGTRLGDWVVVEVASDYDDLRQRIVRAEVDLAWAPPTICAQVSPKVRKIFKSVRGGSSVYRAAIIARAGAFESISDLSGARAAWVDELSTGGHLLAKARLKAANIPADALASETFYGSYGAVVRAVLEGKADFGSVYVRTPTEASVMATITSFVGRANAERIEAVAFTQGAPSDGLVVTERSNAGGNVVDLVALTQMVSKPSGTSMLLSLLDADHLELAAAGEYSALAQL